MKFLKTYAACLAISEAFLCCGGFWLLDFQKRPFVTFGVVAFLAAVLVSVWLSQEERIDTLEKRARDLEERVWTLENQNTKKDSVSKENDL